VYSSVAIADRGAARRLQTQSQRSASCSKWLIDVAIVCPPPSQWWPGRTHLHPGVSAKAGEAVKRKKYKGAVPGFVVEAGGRLGPAAKKFIVEVVAARKAAASKIMRAIGIEVMHKQAYILSL
jgi:hypothetical protein